jgi:pyridoxamine 5'-phosphate oxidase
MIVSHKIPFELFKQWFDEAQKNEKIIEPTAMCLSTVSADGKPSSRMVLLKKFDESGFCFFTNLTSR